MGGFLGKTQPARRRNPRFVLGGAIVLAAKTTRFERNDPGLAQSSVQDGGRARRGMARRPGGGGAQRRARRRTGGNSSATCAEPDGLRSAGQSEETGPFPGASS